MLLSTYLRRASIVTGPLLGKNTSHSRMQSAKKFLLGQEQFKGGEKFLNFGDALHKKWLVDSDEFRLTEEEHKIVKAMVSALNKHAIAKSLKEGAVVENKRYKKFAGVLVAYILDILKKKIGADLKTTSCNTKIEFEDKAKDYGYFAQAELYMQAENLKYFYFIGVTKSLNPKIFILDVSQHPTELAYAKEEIKFLLYFYKHYGNVIAEGERLKGSPQIENQSPTMAKGKEALANIVALNKEHKKAAKAAETAKLKLARAIEKFPAKELELYQEKLESLKP